MRRLCRVVLMGVWVVALASCRRQAPPPLASCPSLVRGGWQWVGVVGPQGTVAPFERVELRDADGPLLYGATYASALGSFALRGARPDTTSQPLELVTESGRRFSIRPGPTEALIDYDPATFAVLEEPLGTMTFHGWLASTPRSTPIERAWVVNWATGNVESIEPTPALDVTVQGASVAGGLGDCLAVFSEHRSGGTGGCWWARPGGCVCRRCTAEELAAGTCIEDAFTPRAEDPTLPCGCQYPPPGPTGSDPERSPRQPLPANERHDPPPGRHGQPPPPFREGTGPSPPEPPDAGNGWTFDPTRDTGPVEPPS